MNSTQLQERYRAVCLNPWCNYTKNIHKDFVWCPKCGVIEPNNHFLLLITPNGEERIKL